MLAAIRKYIPDDDIVGAIKISPIFLSQRFIFSNKKAPGTGPGLSSLLRGLDFNLLHSFVPFQDLFLKMHAAGIYQ